MKQIFERISLSLSALLFFGALGLSVPVLAHEDGSSGSGSTSRSSDDVTKPLSDNDETETEVKNHARELAEQFKLRAREHNKTLRESVKTHTEQERRKNCEARKNNLQKRMANAVRQAEKHKAVFDKIYARVKQFHADKQLNVAGYDELVAKVDAAQIDAAEKIAALKSLNLSVDCTQQGLADNVSAFKEAVKEARDSLKVYRAALVDLIKAVHSAAQDSNQTDSEQQ